MGRLRPPLLLAALLAGGCLDFVHRDDTDGAALARVLADPGPGPGPLDVAIAFGCPADDESGLPSPCEQCRIDSAAQAFRRGEVGALILTGGAAHNRFVEADVMAEALIARGVPPPQVHREPRALTTWMNFRYARRIMVERGFRTALLISTADHLPRVARFAHYYGVTARYRACDRPAE